MLIFAKLFINITQNLGKGWNLMQNIEKDFSAVAQKIGFGRIAELANVAYQVVSRMAKNPRPGYKYHVRRRVLTAVIEESERRITDLRSEADRLETQIADLKIWREQAFVK